VAEGGHNRFAVARHNDIAKLHVYAEKCTVMLTTLDSTVEYIREKDVTPNPLCLLWAKVIFHSTPFHFDAARYLALWLSSHPLGKEDDDPH